MGNGLKEGVWQGWTCGRSPEWLEVQWPTVRMPHRTPTLSPLPLPLGASCATLLLCPHEVAAYDGKDDGDKEGSAVWLEQAVGILVAQLLLGARVGALLPRSGSNVSNNHDIVSACVGLALNTMLLLLLWLEGANGPNLALVVGGIVELTGYTDWHAAVSLRGGARRQGGSTRLTILTATVQTLGPKCAHGEGLALSGEPQLLSVWTVVAALVL